MNNNRKGAAPKSAQKNAIAAYRNVRDPITTNALSASPAMFSATTNSLGAWSNQFILAPLGVNGVVIVSAAAGSPSTFQSASIFSPLLPWLYNTSRNFERYRVTRAVLIFVSNVGSTTTGQLMMDTTTDSQDLTTPATASTSSGGKVFDLATASSKELRFQCDVDSSWKKVSNQTYATYNTNTLSIGNSVNDLLFTCPVLAINGGPASTAVGNFYVEYDVQFRDPISFAANA